MTSSSKPAEISSVKYELEVFLLGDEFDLYEDQRLIASVAPSHSAAEVSYGKLIFSCWGEDWSKSWRVLDAAASGASLRLDCTKQLGTKRCIVELKRDGFIQLSQSRTEFASKLGRLIESSLGFAVEQNVTSQDSLHNLSGVHTRLLLRDRLNNRLSAGIAVCSAESQAHVDAVLGSAIRWAKALQARGTRIDRLFVFIPIGRGTTIANRLTAVAIKDASITCFEIDEETEELRSVAPYDQGDLADNFKAASSRAIWPGEKRVSPEIASWAESIRSIAPEHISARSRGGEISFAIRGLEFACINIRSRRVELGVGDEKSQSAELDHLAIGDLVQTIIKHRISDPVDRGSLYYRLQPERWLESILRDDISALDPSLDSRFVYSQVPTYRGEQRTYIDLLAVTRSGRLVVIELKVAEDPEFPFQGLDYWQRVEWHRQRGDFERRGYFPGLKLSNEPPLLYLVAPLFRFHQSIKLIAESIRSAVPVYKIGINERWRGGVRVLLVEKLN
ncbi:MAG: hypothetical protein DMF61_25100 [Blastocatellia bacterium AA13]|nr:MAG: hypothetical protein DMF61_25100 [Blastocatellia bacterium AA13]